ncbi:vacuolar protein sorting-associated protein-like protein vps17 [Dothidotthia symphoricarpi CBS 119687]|uniref:Vacuolar protein sorting-associated protein 17 n=1 Tax=Dothidotthia symphoricarpi CBS 119687 TaxID=1392245 RepID=A0A6A6A356_9PLEO|nr:vacuolar protein sorting-associated protein-like protein vps17 [Dothidotthia symphoricarpi CBS 119687]KAF2126240.1 vacuolar protein sorting-associated protein-like protein vps17 [Dothidotthia symphoricarpi CBS 119687]
MDYTADSDPWASSPKHNRSSFGQPPTGDIPSSPLPPQASPYGQGSEQYGYMGDHDAQNRPNAAPENGDHQQQPRTPGLDAPQSPQAQHQAQQQAPGPGQQPQRYHGTRPQRQQQQQYKLQAKVTGLERTGKKDTILRFDVYTNLPKFRTTQFRDVRRLHSEFVKLGEHLISACPEAIVPAVPPATTSAGAGTEEDEARLKSSMQRWLNTVCSNDVLIRDEEMVFFVESDFGYSPVVRRKQPATGVRRKVIKQFAPPPDDTPELAAARPTVKAFYLGTMDTEQKVEKMVKHRRNLGVAESDLGTKFAAMHAQETHVGLSHAYKKLGKVIQAMGDFHAAQGTAEATTLGDPLQYHSSDAFIAKETLTNRHILLRELLQAQSATKSKLSAADRLKASSSVKRDKVDEAIAALDEARSHEQYLTSKAQRVTQNLLHEQRKWFDRTTADMRQAIREYVIREIEAERRTLATLESVRPDIRAIDGSGGLSRLGREAHPPQRRAPMVNSQGPKGDAWSGVPRRPGDGLNRSMSGNVPLPVADDEENDEEVLHGRKRATSNGSQKAVEEDEDRIDARNAASRLATTTF